MTNPDLKKDPTNWKLCREWIFDREGNNESQRRQVYAVTCWIYHGVYFALLSVYEYPGDLSEGQSTDYKQRHERDVMDFYIATSRDGDVWDLHWVYASQPMVPRGSSGAFDKDIVLPSSTIVTHDDRHWIYYSGANERHGTEQVRFQRRHAVGLATLRLDGFVGMAAYENAGVIITKPFILEAESLRINVNAPQGEVVVELLDEAGQALPEFSGENAAIGRHIDDIRWRPVWKKHADVTVLKGQTVRLKFTLRQAKLYAFQPIRD